MKRILVVLITLGLTLSPATQAEAKKTVPYKNQKAGQFCKTIDIGKRVKVPDGTKLRCKKDGTRARWTK